MNDVKWDYSPIVSYIKSTKCPLAWMNDVKWDYSPMLSFVKLRQVSFSLKVRLFPNIVLYKKYQVFFSVNQWYRARLDYSPILYYTQQCQGSFSLNQWCNTRSYCMSPSIYCTGNPMSAFSLTVLLEIMTLEIIWKLIHFAHGWLL